MALPDGAASVWAVATRISQLDQNGFPAAGLNSFIINQLVKMTWTPVLETGDDIVVRNGAGDLVVFAKHGDMIKYYTVQLDIATPDPAMEQAVAGGTLLGSSAAALGAPTGATAVPQITLGTLAAATYGYRVTQFNQYGESTPQGEVTAAVASGTTGTVVVTGATMAAGALGVRIYGRTPGGEQLLGAYSNIGTQATSSASGTGPSTLAVTALTKPIPKGFQFTIAGDGNSPKIVFKTLAAAGVGATSLSVTYLGSPGAITTIAAGNIVPVFVDDGTLTPLGTFPTADSTAGPGAYTGYQAPALGIVANPNGVSVELFQKAIRGGYQDTTYPYYRWVFPGCKGLHQTPRTLANQNTDNMYEGQAFENPNWGSGPFGDWQWDSTKVFQRDRIASDIVPTVFSFLPVVEAY